MGTVMEWEALSCFKLKGIAVNITMPDSERTTDLRLTLKFNDISRKG